MALRKLRPLTFRPKGLSDAIDGTNSFPGSMQALANLVSAPGTSGIFIPRVAAQLVTSFAGFNTPSAISALLVLGTRAYGMIGSQRFAGRDEPFCFNLVANAFIAIAGVTAAKCPLTQSPIGDWTPPTISAVTNSRIIVTHPGYQGGAGPYFGWFDISSFANATLKGNTTNGSAVIASIYDGGTSAPIIDGVQPGQAITGPGIPAGATVLSAANGNFTLATTGSTHGNTTLDTLASIVGVAPGMGVNGPQFVAGTYVVNIAGGVVTLSQAALGSVAGTAVVFSGGGSITISVPATVTASLVALNIAGGTAATPLWGAGNTNGNALSKPPVALSGFNGRAYYAVDNAVVFSDVLNPTQVTNGSQALILGDGQPVTALAGLPLTSQLTGGIIQALVAFKGVEPFYQITGDAVGATLAVSQVNGSVGTLAPNTICGTPLGLAFIAPDGLRILGLAGTVSEPIGAFGSGVSVPFVNAIYPSRMAAAFNQNTLRVSCQNSQIQGQPIQEYWLNFEEKTWTGPHSFPASLIEGYTGGGQVGFILASPTLPGRLWFHTAVPQNNSLYTENGVPLSFDWQTSLLPDNQEMVMNLIVKTTIAMILGQGEVVTVVAFDEAGLTLDSVQIGIAIPSNVLIWNVGKWNLANWGPAGALAGAAWGGVKWGAFNWGSITGFFKQIRIPWHLPLVFKQGSLQVTGLSQAGFAIGNMYLGYQPLGYMIEDGL